MKFIVRFSSNIKITYGLVDDPITTLWADEISRFTINDCCKINHFTNFANEEKILKRVERLYQLADIINENVTEKIKICPIPDIDYKSTMQNLAVMHVHFPEMHNDPNFIHLDAILSEYNDSIHWIEGTIPSLYIDDISKKSMFFTVNLDFNKNIQSNRQEIPEQSYKLFHPYVNFGDLNLGYVHVGRHAQEIYFTNDLICPKDQFLPQTLFTGSIMMMFTNYFQSTDEEKTKFLNSWKKFYHDRGGIDFWGLELDDPKLAFGSIKIGEIEKIVINQQDYKIPKTLDELNRFRNLLVETEVLSWEIE